MDAGLEWLGLVVDVGFVDKLDVVEGAKAVDRSQCLVEVEGFPVVGTNVIHCHLAMFIIIIKKSINPDPARAPSPGLMAQCVVVFVTKPTET